MKPKLAVHEYFLGGMERKNQKTNFVFFNDKPKATILWQTMFKSTKEVSTDRLNNCHFNQKQ